MCGIIGSVSGRFRFSEQDIDIIAHRGPDGAGYFSEGPVMLGHRRLSIVDLSENGNQPMHTADGRFTMVFNGEIYNHQVIRERLLKKGVQFRSTSDTETLLYGFAEYGTRVLEELNGIFAFAIYDRQLRQVTLARDQFGLKPLYYYDRNGIFAFSSELKALTRIPGFENGLDHQALCYYIQALYAPSPMTPLQSVKKVMPGHFIVLDVDTGSWKDECYYRLTYPVEQGMQEADAIAELDRTLRSAVSRQLMSDVPLGYFLSGGLDSSLIVAVAKDIMPDQRLRCYTISAGKAMKEEGFADDLGYARMVAKHLNVDLEVLDADQDILHNFDKMIWHLDEPQADPAPLHVYNICSGARARGIKVLLGGTAGDDLFSGYRRHRALQLEKYYALMPGFLQSALAWGGKSLGTGSPLSRRLKKLSAEVGKPREERMAGYFMWMQQDKTLDLFHPDLRNALRNQKMPEAFYVDRLHELPPGTDDLNRMLYLEMTTFLPDHNLNYTDKMSMAAGVEGRVPFLDTELVALAGRMPVHLKMRGQQTKYILKKVAEKYLPHDVIYRPKTGFGAPVRKWIKEDLKPMVNQCLEPGKLARQGIFDPVAVQELVRLNDADKVDASYAIWSLLAIESWIRQFIGE